MIATDKVHPSIGPRGTRASTPGHVSGRIPFQTTTIGIQEVVGERQLHHHRGEHTAEQAGQCLGADLQRLVVSHHASLLHQLMSLRDFTQRQSPGDVVYQLVCFEHRVQIRLGTGAILVVQ